jgi:hypothetical protein
MYHSSPDPEKGAVRLNRAARRARKFALQTSSDLNKKDAENATLNKVTFLTEAEAPPQRAKPNSSLEVNSEKSQPQLQKTEVVNQDFPESYWRIRDDVETKLIVRSAFIFTFGVLTGFLICLTVIKIQIHYWAQ